MKNKKTNPAEGNYVKGYEPRKLRFKSGITITTNGLTKEQRKEIQKLGSYKKTSLKNRKKIEPLTAI
jgi:hypothetical protein